MVLLLENLVVKECIHYQYGKFLRYNIFKDATF